MKISELKEELSKVLDRFEAEEGYDVERVEINSRTYQFTKPSIGPIPNIPEERRVRDIRIEI